MNKWISRFMDLAEFIGSWSKDTKFVGCVITSKDNKILATGYNGMPPWFDDDTLLNLEPYDKGRMISHAEENALNILDKAHIGKNLNLYVTKPPCKWCTLFIINSVYNIDTVYYKPFQDEEFNAKYDVSNSIQLLLDNNIKVIKYEDV